ncbi:hypothetical protein [uncultured Alistipes sp.]|jgi:hypothetical protein|uniref:hypothetical protein n=1 Tax=uncultured Alistipes sp. TaxID=538949 RepID=UPI0025FE96C6|nr:hypothetical protein [uncultured Alistipes sp.]
MTRYRLHTLSCCCTLLMLLAAGKAMPLRAGTPAEELPAPQPTAMTGGAAGATAEKSSPTAGNPASPTLRPPTKRMQHLALRGRSQHTFFANAGYTAILSTIYLAESSSGSLNEGFDISAGYNWTSRRGFGVGIVYSGGFISAERNGIERTSRLHYIAPEFVARQRAGRRWLFRESAGIGYGRYIRSYGDLSGSRGGVGIHESASVEYMLTRYLGLGVNVGGQWLIVDSPDVDDGGELNLVGIFRFQIGGGIRFYF